MITNISILLLTFIVGFIVYKIYKWLEKPEKFADYLNWKESLIGTIAVFKLKDNIIMGIRVIKKGTLFVVLKDRIWMLATPTDPKCLIHWGTTAIQEAYENDLFEETSLLKEKWVHPHINKEVKKYFPIFQDTKIDVWDPYNPW